MDGYSSTIIIATRLPIAYSVWIQTFTPPGDGITSFLQRVNLVSSFTALKAGT
jgi:hypothetical protein